MSPVYPHPAHCPTPRDSEFGIKTISQPPPFPLELTDQIIDYLHGDVHSLLSCSLTCRAFVPASQYHLFRTVSLSLTYTGTRSTAFLSFLERNPRPAFYVRYLKLEERSTRPGLSVETIVPMVARNLTHVTRLKLSWINFRKESVRKAFISHRLMGLRSLTVSFSSFCTVQDLTELLSAHPYVESLELRNVSWENTVGAHESPRFSVFHSVVWSGVTCTGPLIDWIFTHPPETFDAVGNLTTTLEDAPIMSRLLQYLGPTLQHLQLGITTLYAATRTSDVANALCLASSTGLRTLCLDLSHQPRRYEASWILVVLSQVTSCNLERITFRICSYEAVDNDSLPLEAVDEHLAHSAIFRGVNSVEFSLDDSAVCSDNAGGEREGWETIRKRMRWLNKKGILRFIHYPSS